MTISEALRRFREHFGLTQKQVADSIGVHYQSYQRYELGNTAPLVPVLMKIANAYGVSMDYLVGRTDNPNLHFVGENPPIASEEFLDNIILDTRQNHREKLSKLNNEVPEPAFEYADNLLRHYHQALIQKLTNAGVKF